MSDVDLIVSHGSPLEDLLVCYSRPHADLHAELVTLCADVVAADSCLLHPSHLARMRSVINRLHLLTSAESAWPIPQPPLTISRTVPTSIPTTSSPT